MKRYNTATWYNGFFIKQKYEKYLNILSVYNSSFYKELV